MKEKLWRAEHGSQRGANHFVHRLVLGVMRFCKRDKGFDFRVRHWSAEGLGGESLDDVTQMFLGFLGGVRPVDAVFGQPNDRYAVEQIAGTRWWPLFLQRPLDLQPLDGEPFTLVAACALDAHHVDHFPVRSHVEVQSCGKKEFTGFKILGEFNLAGFAGHDLEVANQLGVAVLVTGLV